MSQRPREMYYFEGSAVRRLEDYPERRTGERPERNPRSTPKQAPRPVTRKKISAKADRALAFNLGYTIFVVASVVIMIAACIVMLYMESSVNAKKNDISGLEAELQTIQDDNAAFKITLESMYSLDDVYNVATNELGMVYAKEGQIVYYDSADEDYVKQYQDVPEAN